MINILDQYQVLFFGISFSRTLGIMENSEYLTRFYYRGGHQDIHIWLHREDGTHFILSPAVELVTDTLRCKKIILFNHTAELSFKIQLWNQEVASKALRVLDLKCMERNDCSRGVSWRSIQPIPFKRVRLVYKESSIIQQKPAELQLETGWKNTLWDSSANYSFSFHLKTWNTCQKLARIMRSDPEMYLNKIELEGEIGSVQLPSLGSNESQTYKWPIKISQTAPTTKDSPLAQQLLQLDFEKTGNEQSEALKVPPKGINIQIMNQTSDYIHKAMGFMVYYDRSPLERYFNRKSVGEYTPLFEKAYFNGDQGFNITTQEFVARYSGLYLFQIIGQTEIWGFHWEIQLVSRGDVKATKRFEVEQGGACCETLVSTALWKVEAGDSVRIQIAQGIPRCDKNSPCTFSGIRIR